MIATLACMLTLADPSTYLQSVTQEMGKQWPANRAVTIVCHGHSVPAGYFVTPIVDTFNAYPHLLHVSLKKRFPHAVINVINTAIGGENSLSGAARFQRDVMSLRPDVVTIDYSLNDRGVPIEKAKEAWVTMIRAAKAGGAKVLLLTPTADQSANILDENDILAQHAAQVRAIAADEGVGLVDSFKEFQGFAKAGTLVQFMSQVNHPNRAGHDAVVKLLEQWFPKP